LKVRLTPLNIISAVCLVLAVFVSVWSVVAAVLAFISDLIFRRLVPSLKKLWIIEGVLIVFVVILIFIIKASI